MSECGNVFALQRLVLCVMSWCISSNSTIVVVNLQFCGLVTLFKVVLVETCEIALPGLQLQRLSQ